MPRIIEVNIGNEAVRVFRPLISAHGVSGRANVRIAQKLREILRLELYSAVVDAYTEGTAPDRTGRGRRLLLQGVRAFGSTLRNVRGHIVSPPYLIAHEEGATIKPKNAKALAIPMEAALRPDGTPKLPGPRSWGITGSFIWTSPRTGRGFIVRRPAGGGKKLVFLYVLVEETQLRKYKGFMSDAWAGRLDNLIEAFGFILLEEMARVNLVDLVTLGYIAGRGRGVSRIIRR